MKWPSFFRSTPKAPPTPKLADAYHKIEQIVKDLDLVKFMLQDTKDWGRLSEEHRGHSLVQLAEFWKRSHFQTSCLRDQMILTLQLLPNTRLVRKKVNAQETKN